MIRKYGFTGTREGLNNKQKQEIINFLEGLDQSYDIELHHGDCVGADKDMHEICQNITSKNIKIVIHPPTSKGLRAFCKSEHIMKPKPYLDRNRDIVDSTDELIGCPKNKIEELRSGTWSTIRYARKMKKPVILFHTE